MVLCISLSRSLCYIPCPSHSTPLCRGMVMGSSCGGLWGLLGGFYGCLGLGDWVLSKLMVISKLMVQKIFFVPSPLCPYVYPYVVHHKATPCIIQGATIALSASKARKWIALLGHVRAHGYFSNPSLPYPPEPKPKFCCGVNTPLKSAFIRNLV